MVLGGGLSGCVGQRDYMRGGRLSLHHGLVGFQGLHTVGGGGVLGCCEMGVLSCMVVGFAWGKWTTWSSSAFRIECLTCKFPILYPPLLYDAQLAIGLAVAHVSMFRCVDACRVFFLHLYITHMHAAHICTHMTHMHIHKDCMRLYTSSTHAGGFTLLQGYRWF